MGRNSRCVRHRPSWPPHNPSGTSCQILPTSTSFPRGLPVVASWVAKNRCGDSLWLVGFGRSGVWSLRGAGSLTPKLGCRAGRWCKNDPKIRVSDRSMMQEWAQIWVSGRSVMQEWPPNLTSELSGRWKWPPNSMLGVVGRVKRTPKFDAQGGRKGKTDPQIWCSGWSEG